MAVLARNIKVIKTSDININDEFFNPLKREKHYLWANINNKKDNYGSFEELWNMQSYVYVVYNNKDIKAMMGLYIPAEKKVKTKIGISILKASKLYYDYYDYFINSAITIAQIQGCFAVELVIADSNKYLIKKIKSKYDCDTYSFSNEGFVKITIYTD